MSTIRQKRLARIVDKGSTKTEKEAMLQAGYSPNTAIKPSQVKKSKGWKDLLEKYLPDNDLLKVHKEGLKATKIHGSMTEPDRIVPDYPTRHKYMESGYKVKGKLVDPKDSEEKSITIIIKGYDKRNKPSGKTTDGVLQES